MMDWLLGVSSPRSDAFLCAVAGGTCSDRANPEAIRGELESGRVQPRDTVWPTGQYIAGVSYLLRIIIIGSSTLGLSRPMRPESTGGNGTDPVASETQDAGCKRRSHRQCYSGAIHGCFGECQSLLRQPATSNVRPGSIMTSAVEVLPPAPIIV